MRVVLVTYGSRGDVEPMAALAKELGTRGAEVRVCAPPEEEFGTLLARAGATHVPFGQSVRELVRTATPEARPTLAPKVAAALVAAHFDTVAPAAEGCDAVLASGLMPAGVRSVAELLGVPYVFALFQPIGLPTPDRRPGPRPGPPLPPGVTDNRELWKLDAERVNALYGGALDARRAAAGLPPVENVRDHVITRAPWLASDPVLWPYEDETDLDVVQLGAWILPDDRPLPAGLTAFLDAGPPPVYAGFGSMALHGAGDVARTVIEAIRSRGRRAVVSGGWADLAAIDDGDDVHVVTDDVNQQALFPRTAAVVHHGGAGTTTTASRSGTPQVVVPQIVDQPYWAARVAALGIGAAHDGPVPTAGSLSAALATALDPRTAGRAAGIAERIRTDGAGVAAEMLLTAAGRSRSSRSGASA